MISKLKKKFTVLATISMFILMTILVFIMNLVNFTSVARESDNTIDMLSKQNANFTQEKSSIENPANPNDDFVPRGMSPEVPYESRYFTVTVDESGVIQDTDLSKIISVDSSSVRKYIRKAVNSNATRGFIGQFRFLKQTEDGNTKVIFLDCGRKLDAFYTFLWTSMCVGLFGCIIVFVAFLFISGKIVKPISEAYEKQKRFISDAGHEIKTPLTIINANVDLLECDGEKEELTEIRNQTKRLTELTNNLVYLSKMEESDSAIQKIEMPMSDIVFETANSFTTVAATKNINIIRKITPDISVNGSPEAIRQLVSILLDNSVKYTPNDGNIWIELYLYKRSIVLLVANTTEEPVNNDSLPYVFDRFYRTDNSRNSSTGGHGIGLSIAKAIVEAHGGKITATTKSGNDFCVTAVFYL